MSRSSSAVLYALFSVSEPVAWPMPQILPAVGALVGGSQTSRCVKLSHLRMVAQIAGSSDRRRWARVGMHRQIRTCRLAAQR